VQAAGVIGAAKTGDHAALAAAQAQWSANSGDIAAFFSGANPNWRRAELEPMPQTHLDLTTGENRAPQDQKLRRKTAKPQPVIFQRVSDAVPTRNRKRKHCLQMSDPRGAVSDVDAVRDIRKECAESAMVSVV
jgi:hypothetical protein